MDVLFMYQWTPSPRGQGLHLSFGVSHESSVAGFAGDTQLLPMGYV